MLDLVPQKGIEQRQHAARATQLSIGENIHAKLLPVSDENVVMLDRKLNQAILRLARSRGVVGKLHVRG